MKCIVDGSFFRDVVSLALEVMCTDSVMRFTDTVILIKSGLDIDDIKSSYRHLKSILDIDSVVSVFKKCTVDDIFNKVLDESSVCGLMKLMFLSKSTDIKESGDMTEVLLSFDLGSPIVPIVDLVYHIIWAYEHDIIDNNDVLTALYEVYDKYIGGVRPAIGDLVE